MEYFHLFTAWDGQICITNEYNGAVLFDKKKEKIARQTTEDIYWITMFYYEHQKVCHIFIIKSDFS